MLYWTTYINPLCQSQWCQIIVCEEVFPLDTGFRRYDDCVKVCSRSNHKLGSAISPVIDPPSPTIMENNCFL